MTPRTKLRRLAASTLGTALTATLTVGLLATPGAGASALSSVSMGTEPWIGYAPWYIAQQEGYFTKYGLKVNIVNFEEDADRNAALVAGKTDVSNIATGRTIQFANQAACMSLKGPWTEQATPTSWRCCGRAARHGTASWCS